RALGLRGQPARQRRHQGVLPRPHRSRRAQVLPRRQALQAPQTLAELGERSLDDTDRRVGKPAVLVATLGLTACAAMKSEPAPTPATPRWRRRSTPMG